MVRTLVVTNDLPPRTGGIQTFLHEVLRRQDPRDIVVFGPRHEGSETFDATAGYEIHRHDGPIIPAPWVAKRAAEVAAISGASQVMLGSGMPNAHLIPFLRRLGLPTSLVITHGNEAGWAQLPGGRALVYPLNGARNVTYLGPFTKRILGKYVKPESRLHRLPPVLTPTASTLEAGVRNCVVA
jgi:phosphatidyl-myo-inositol dimannoside synthase